LKKLRQRNFWRDRKPLVKVLADMEAKASEWMSIF
jgi:hypothetical protein